MATSGMTAQIGRVLGGRYRLLAPLGSGASAQVFLADDVRLQRRVAVKVLHPALADDESFLRRFRSEAQSAASLNHPHILAVFDWNGDGGAPFLVTEYLGGGSLRAMLDAGRRLSQAQALVVGLEATRALGYAHGQGFVHRDIKPANLLFGQDTRLRVADFGLARAIAEAGWTETGAVLGTARYASPEQARGEKVDGRSDVYSLALVVVEAVTGQVPFATDTTIGTLMARLEQPLAVPPALGPLVPVLTAAGQPDRARRIDAAELGEGLIAAAAALSKPGPLPLVGAGAPTTPATEDDRDRTLMGEGADVTERLHVGPVRISGSTAPPARRANGSQPWDTGEHPRPVLSAGDRSARRLMLGAVVVVAALAVGMAGVWIYMRAHVPTHTVPDSLVGMQQGDLLGEIGGFGWNIRIEEVRADGTAAGEILETRPVGGTDLREGETLTVVVSQGPTLVDVPAGLVGMSEDDAVAALAAAGLAADVVREPSREADEGTVIGFADGDPGPQVPRGSTVGLVVSSGDEVEIPDLEGRDVQEAVDELERLGLEVEIRGREPDGDVAPGEVIRTKPDAGDDAELGDRVIVVVAVERVEVPEVGGLDLDEATERIEDVGLSVGDVQGFEDGVVLLTWPLEGSEVDTGSSVDLVMRREL